jgi:hypothetical protein
MKKKIVQLLILLALILSACEILNDGTDKDYVFGVIKHKYTKIPIPGITLQIDQYYYDKNNYWEVDTIFNDKTISNNKGEFMLNLKDSKNYSIYLIRNLLPSIIDTTKTLSKFIPSSIFLDSDDLNEADTLNIELEPAGKICFFVTDKTLDSLSVAEILITSQYETKSLTRGNTCCFYVDPSIVSQFSWYYIKNGVKSNILSKQIYVANSVSTNYKGFSYQISFK